MELAIYATALMSITSSVGLVGLSRKNSLVFGPDRLFPVLDVRPSTSVALMPYFGINVSMTQRQEPNSALAATMWSPAVQAAEDRRGDGRHARCHRAGVLRAFQRAHALLEHIDGRIGIARIDETGLLALETRFRAFGRVVDVALRHVDRFRRLAKCASAACPRERVALPASSYASLSSSCPRQQKNRPRKSQPVHMALQPDGPLATCLTWLQADRPNHHGITSPLDLSPACVNRAVR